MRILILMCVVLPLFIAVCSCNSERKNEFTSNSGGKSPIQAQEQTRSNTYKSEYVFAFVASCVQKGGNSKVCGCIMDQIIKEMSQDDLLKMETEIIMGKQPSEKFTTIVTNARIKCN